MGLDNPLFMIGFGRSGTSILSEAISLHEGLGWLPSYLNRVPNWPWITFLNRLTFLPGVGRYLRGKKPQQSGLSAKIRRWLPYSAEVFPAWEYCLGRKFAWDYLIDSIATDEERACTRRYVHTALAYQGRNVLFNKFTGPPRIAFLSSIFPQARFLHITRDPRAVVSSLLKVDFWRDKGGLDGPWWENGLPDEAVARWQSSEHKAEALAAVQWRFVMELMDKESARLSADRYLEMRYEDFVERPLESLQRVFDHFKLPESPAAEHYITSLGRLRNMNHKFHEFLTEGAIAEIEQITAPVARSKGYI